MRLRVFSWISIIGVLVQLSIAPLATCDTKAPRTQRISGVIKDALGRPIQQAALRLQGAGGRVIARSSSNVAGEFSFDAIARGKYAVVVTKPGYRSATAIVVLSDKAAPSMTIAMEAQKVMSLQIVAKRRTRPRASVSNETGGSVYKFTQQTIQDLPEGSNTPVSQVLLQAPGVAQDSFGELHVRGDHGDLQYRINGVQLPEGISGFGQTISARFAESINLLTGSLPAEYGYRTAGVVDIRTKSGSVGNSGSVEMYGGQRGTLQPSFEFGGAKGDFTYFVTGQYLRDNLGIQPPTPGPTPIHDHTEQGQSFGYFSYALTPTTKLSLITGTATEHFEIPANRDQMPSFALHGVTNFPSIDVADNQFEQNYFGVLALQGTLGAHGDYQLAGFSRYSTISFKPDYRGDLVFNGVASNIFRSSSANGLQGDSSYHLGSAHTLRAGFYFSGERAEIDNHAAVFPTFAGKQSSDIPFGIVDNTALTAWLYGVYMQDEWKPVDKLTVNFGARFDLYDGLLRADQLSPRFSVVYRLFNATTVHAGYARYFTPPPTELVSVADIKKFQNTTNATASNGNGTPSPARDHNFDAGVTETLMPGFEAGIDGYYKISRNLLDEGQFGQALVFSPFNYQKGRVYGVELTGSYSKGAFNAYSNFAYSVAQGINVESGQFNFTPAELHYIHSHYVFLDHDQTFSSSVGATYRWRGFLFTMDSLYGSGLRRGFANTGNLPYYVQVNAGITRQFEVPEFGAMEARIAIVNLFDRTYQLRNGTGIGAGAAHYGPRRALYAGLKWELPFSKLAGSQAH